MRPPPHLEPSELDLLERAASLTVRRPVRKRELARSHAERRALSLLLRRGLLAYRPGPCRAYVLCTLEGREHLSSRGEPPSSAGSLGS